MARRMRRTCRILVGLVLVAFAVAACFGDDPALTSVRDAGTDARLPDEAGPLDAGGDGQKPPTPTGTARWLKPIVAPANSLIGPTRSTMDANGNVVVVGYLFGEGTFDFGDGKTLASTAAVGSNGFIAKYGPDGVCQWAKLVAGADDDLLYAVASGPDGEIVAIGETGSSAVTVAMTVANQPADSGTSNNILVVKLNADGTLAWHRIYGGSGWDEGHAVAIGTNGDILLGGRVVTNAQTVRFDTVSILEQASDDQIGAVVLLDKDGKGKWARGLPKVTAGSSNDTVDVSALAFDALGDVLVGGWFSETVRLRPNPPLQYTSNGADDGWVAKLSGASGETSWGVQLGGAAGDRVDAITVDPNLFVYVGGTYTGPGAVTFGGTNLPVYGGVDAFVLKLDPSSKLEWAHGYGTPGKDDVGGIAVDPWGNIVLGGGQDQTIDWNGASSTSAGNDDGYVVKLAATGASAFWAHGLGSSAQDLGFGGIAVSPSTGFTSVTGGLKGNALLAGKTFTVADGGTMNGFVLLLDP